MTPDKIKEVRDKIKKRDPAFATTLQVDTGEVFHQAGMSKRFYAATTAMQGIMANSHLMHPIDLPKDSNDIIKLSYKLADELLKQE